MIPSDTNFKANPAERSAPSRAVLSRVDPRWHFAALCVGVAYAILLSALLVEDRRAPAALPEAEAIPVEIVIEPRPEKKPDPPPAKPEPSAQAQPPAEEPAFDAPRAGNNEKTEAEATDRAAKPPPEPASAKPPGPDPAPEAAAGPKQEGDLKSRDNAAERASDKPAEVTRPASEKPDETQALAALQAQAAQPRTSAAFQLPAYESAPEFDFGSLFKQTPVAGGTAKATYLSTLYGMIVPRMRAPLADGAQTSSLEGTILFNVDGKGNLMQRRILHESGSRDLDKAALEAVRQAAPFPPPPQGKPVELRFTYGAK